MDNEKKLIRDLLELLSDNDKLLKAISPMPQDFQEWLYAVGWDFASNLKHLKTEVKDDIVDKLAVYFGLEEKDNINDEICPECGTVLDSDGVCQICGFGS